MLVDLIKFDPITSPGKNLCSQSYFLHISVLKILHNLNTMTRKNSFLFKILINIGAKKCPLYVIEKDNLNLDDPTKIC